MWFGEVTDMVYEDVFTLVCFKHKSQKDEVKNRDKIQKLLKDTFTVMKAKSMSFMLEDDLQFHSEVIRDFLYKLKIFSRKVFQKHQEKVEKKDLILKIDSVNTITLALFSKICCICEKIENLEDFIIHRDKQELLPPTNGELRFDGMFFNCACHPHYPKVQAQFGRYPTNIIKFAFAVSCYSFATTFGTDVREFWDHFVETPIYHQYRLSGNDAYNNKEYETALRIYMEALKQFPYSYLLYGNCAQVCLTLHKYKLADLLSRFALIINPQWCKAYYKLAVALFHQKNAHKAHLIAEFGLRQCHGETCNERESLKEYANVVQIHCGVCNQPTFSNDEPTSNSQVNSNCNNQDSDDLSIPDLTDSTDSGSETDCMSEVESTVSPAPSNVDSEPKSSKNQEQNTTLAQVSDGTLNQVPDATLDKLPDTSLGQVPDATLDKLPDTSLGQVPDATLDQTPGTALDKVSAAILDQDLNATVNLVPDAIMDQVPYATLDQVSDATLDQVSDATLDQVSDATLDQVPNASLSNGPNTSKDVLDMSMSKASELTINQEPDTSQSQVLNPSLEQGQNLPSDQTPIASVVQEQHPSTRQVPCFLNEVLSQQSDQALDLSLNKLNMRRKVTSNIVVDVLGKMSKQNELSENKLQQTSDIPEDTPTWQVRKTHGNTNSNFEVMKICCENEEPRKGNLMDQNFASETEKTNRFLQCMLSDLQPFQNWRKNKAILANDDPKWKAENLLKKACEESSLRTEYIVRGKQQMYHAVEANLSELEKMAPSLWQRVMRFVNRLKIHPLKEDVMKNFKTYDGETYEIYEKVLERAPCRFDVVYDLLQLTLDKYTMLSGLDLSDENSYLFDMQMKEISLRENDVLFTLVKLENLFTKVENFAWKNSIDQSRQNHPKVATKAHRKKSPIAKQESEIEISADTREKLGKSLKLLEEIPPCIERMDSADDLCLDYGTVTNLGKALREGTSAVKMGLMSSAMLHFSQALEIVRQVPELCEKFEMSAIAVRFAYGYACYKCNSAESMTLAIDTFKEIIGSKEKNLGSVYYLLGLAWAKFHNFQVALSYLQTVASMTEEDFNFQVCDLLDENSMKEINYETVKMSLKEEISKCECPPPPDAICRYKSCSLGPAIYFANLAFKKFMCIRCQERCVLQYHVICWKAIKDSKTDKEFLDKPCFTPDCDGLIIKVELVGKDGILERDFVSEGNYKSKKSVKQKKTKLEKKQEQKERKRRQVRSQTLSESLEATVDEPEPEPVSENIQSNELNNAECQSPTKMKRMLSNDSQAAADEAKPGFEMAVHAEPLYIIKRDANEKECDNKPSKHKERKKPKKSVFSIDQFCENFSTTNVTSWSEYQLRVHRLQESKRVVEEQAAPAKWNSKYTGTASYMPVVSYDVPENFDDPDEVKTSSAKFAPLDDYYEIELRSTINEHFINFLQTHRFIKLTSPLLIEEIRKLSKKARDFIDRKGGFQPFLQGSGEFAIVNGNLCLFSDMMSMYKSTFNDVIHQCSSNEILENIGIDGKQMNDCNIPSVDEDDSVCPYLDVDQLCGSKNIEELDDFTDECNSHMLFNNVSKCEENKGIEVVTALNPNAEEYNPSKDSSSESSQPSHETLKNGSSPLCQPPTLIDNSFLSRVAGMRQELEAYSIMELDKKSEESPEPPKPEEEQVPSTLMSNEASPCDDMNDYPKFIDYFHSHIRQLIDSNDKKKLSKVYSCLKFILQQMTKIYTANVGSQIGTATQVVMVSQGVMKKDHEFAQLTDEAKALKDLNTKLFQEKAIIEQQLTEALDKQTELQNKYSVEMTSLKKEMEDKKVAFQEELQVLKKKHSTLEKDLKLWRQKHGVQMDKEKLSQTENEILQAKIKNLMNKVSELEKEKETLKMDFQLRIHNQSDIVDEYEKQLQKETEENKRANGETLLAKERLKSAQLEILHLKKAGYLQSFGIILEQVNSNIQELKGGIERLENSPPSVINSLKILQSKLHEYVKDMHGTRIQFIDEISHQVKQVESGVSLTQLPKLQIPAIPPIPTVHTIMGNVASEQDASTSLGLQKVPMNSARTSEQMQQKTFQNFSPHMLNQTFVGSYGSNSTAGLGLLKSSVPGQSTGHFSSLPQQNSLFPNFNIPLFGAYQSRNVPSPLPMAPTLPSEGLPAPIGSQLSSKLLPGSNHFGSSVATAFNHKMPPPGLFSQPSNSSASSPSPTIEFEQNPPSLFSEKKQPKSYCSSTFSLSDSESIPLPKTLPSASLLEASLDAKEFSSKSSTDMNDSCTPLELAYSSHKQAATTSVPKPLSVAAEANGMDTLDSFVGKKKNSNLKKGYRKILELLQKDCPGIPDSLLIRYVKEYRAKMGGRLSNLPLGTINADICAMIQQQTKKTTGPNMVAFNRPKSLVIKPLTSCSTPVPPPTASKPAAPSVAPWAKVPAPNSENVPQNWYPTHSERICSICLEEMNLPHKTDCGHQFHSDCIKQWLSTQSNCPVCRVHLLLPEDFPALC